MSLNGPGRNIIVARNSSTQLAEVMDNHSIAFPTWSTLPTAGADYRGMPFYTEGGEAVADTLTVVAKNASDTYDTFYPVLSTASNFSSAGQLRNVIDTGGAFATPVVLTADQSGSTILLDDAAGLDFTLPVISAANVGMNFRFRLITEVTSNSYRITAGEATDLFIGGVIMLDKDAATGDANALIGQFRADVSNDDALTIAGADDTTGALVGGYVDFEAVTAARWFVTGVLWGDGSLATVFA